MRIITLAIAFLICTAAEAQVIRAEPFYTAPEEAAPAANLLLDSFPGAAVAYSLRKLDKDYTGSAIRVRRSSDNTEQDIGFFNNYLDTAAMKTFVGNNNGFVVTWYNQADSSGVFGVKNITNTTAANQPMVLSSGTLITNGGDVCVRFDGTNDDLRTTLISAPSSYSHFSVDAYITVAPLVYTLYHVNQNSLTRANNSALQFFVNTASYSGVSINMGANTTQSLLNTIWDGAEAKVAFNANSFTTASKTGAIVQSSSFTMGSQTGVNYASSFVHEFIRYESDQTSNRLGINSNINSFYSIY